MKIFKCQHCAQIIYFENIRCEGCARRLGYIPEAATLASLDPHDPDPYDNDGQWQSAAAPGQSYRFCANAEYDACNWLVPADTRDRFCVACSHNRTVPDLSDSENRLRWQKLERAKHHLFYTLLRLNLPLATRAQDQTEGLAFDFLNEDASPGAKILTGHDSGLITLNLAEADDATRETLRQQMGEPYRTLLGHFRHESGHYFWDRLVHDEGRLDAFRDLFGDERADYAQALQSHYAAGPAPGWQDNFVSAYASAHPWEDFAETWAHYFHIVDTLEMGCAFGLHVHPDIDQSATHHVDLELDPHSDVGIQRLIAAWLPLSFAVNSINRCMGQPDLYPFVLSPAVVAKLGFIDELIHTRRQPPVGTAATAPAPSEAEAIHAAS
jgi:hypothetical protein